MTWSAASAAAERDGYDHAGPVYQRRAFEPRHDFGDWRKGHQQYTAPPVASGWFQRPYPYHLDYYRMRYGGSYAPYFGNLYGPPQVVTASPYYGPYYGGYGDYGGYGYLPYGAMGGYGGPPPGGAWQYGPPAPAGPSPDNHAPAESPAAESPAASQ